MPRLARIHVTGGLFHVISRFHDHRFYLDIDSAREKYLELLGKAADTHDSRIIAYCLMSSHIHLVLQLGNDPLGRLTRKVHAPFGNRINQRRKGLGTILADRPKSVLVHSETHGMSLLRYVHNNPVRAGIVERASESSWSSHRAYLGLEACPWWLATNAVLGPNEEEHESLRHDLACYVDEGRLEERRPELSGEVSKVFARRVRKLMGGDVELSYPILGPDDFVVSALKEQVHRHGDRQHSQRRDVTADAVVRAIFESLSLDHDAASGRSRAPSIARGRSLAAWLWVEKMGHPQVVLADALQVSSAAVTMMLGKLRREGLTNRERTLVDRVFKSLIGKAKGKATGGEIETKDPKVIILKRQRR